MSGYDENMGGGEDDLQPCLCDPCLCDQDCGVLIFKSDEKRGEGEGLCTCDPCECETPPGSPSKSKVNLEEEGAGDGNPYQLDEFSRAKEFFLNTSTKSGLCMYEHLVQVIRKILDERGPINPVDYLEEISMNVKRYKFQIPKDIIRDVFQVSPKLLDDSRFLTSHWKRVNRYMGSEYPGEDGEEDYSQGYVGGSFQNLLRLAYYLEHVNIGLPRDEMFRLAIAIRELTNSRPFITRARFWGKIFGMRKGYYVVETEFKSPDAGIGDLWVDLDNLNGEMEGEGEEEEEETLAIEDQAAADILAADLTSEEILGPQRTLQRAGNVVLDTEFLTPYSKTSGLPPEKIAQLRPKARGDFYQPPVDPALEYGGEGGYKSMLGEMMGEGGGPIELEDTEAMEDAARWHGFMEEFMSNFPTAVIEPEITIPAEPLGTGVNRRAFYVCSSLGEPWILLPITTPELINGSRNIRWALTGELGAPIRSYPEYPGKEGHYLRCLLARAAAGSLASPKGFYKPGAFTGEYPGEDEEDVEEEEESLNAPGDDKVMQVKKYDVSLNLITNPNLDFWVHHAGYILPQGRATWWNPMSLLQPPKNKKVYGEDEDEDEDEEYDEYEGEDEVPGTSGAEREVGPPLFTPISNDTAADGRKAWTLCTSTSIFPEFQVVSIRSNTWTGSTCICTMKGKVDNIYFGDGLKFADRTYCPPPLPPGAAEYKFGPEISEIDDPSVEAEQEWLRKLELSQMIDEPKPVEEEMGEQEEEEEEEEEETEYESDED